MSYQILRTKKLTQFGSIASSAEHTFRERRTPNADPTRTHLNHGTGARSACDVLQAIKNRLKTVEVADDSVLCIEYLVSASPAFFKEKSDEEREKYFADSLSFLQKKHGKKNVICSDIQLDETTPHAVFYVVPIVETAAEGTRKRNVKGPGGTRKVIEVPNKATERLSAKHYLGGRETLSDLQTAFHSQVSEKFGLMRGEKGSKAKHQALQAWYAKLEPSMQRAITVIDEAAAIEKSQSKREEEIKKQVAKIVEAQSFLKTWAGQLKEQRAQLAEALDLVIDRLPTAWVEKLGELFKSKTPQAPVVVVQAPGATAEAQKAPGWPFPGLSDALKPSSTTQSHQKGPKGP